MIRLSPGLAQSCFDLLAYVSRNTASFTEILESFSQIGGMDTKNVVETAQALRWIVASSERGTLQVTSSGDRLVNLTSYEAALRQALLDYIEVERPPWIQNATYGRARVIAFAGNEIAQAFVEAGVVSDDSEPVIDFWDALAARARGLRDDQLSRV